MSIIDRTIEAAFPGWAVRREIARQQLATHRGGLSTRTGTAWGRSNSYRGGRQIERMNQAARRDRARRVYAEHPIGRSLLKTETDNVVSCGFTLQAKTASKEFNSEIEDRFAEWLEIADLRGMLSATDLIRQCYRSPRRDGDGGIILVSSGVAMAGEMGGGVAAGQSRLQYIPGDLICNPYNAMLGPNFLDGVEVDNATRPVAYHIKSQDEWGKLEWERIPAEDFIYLAPEIDDDLAVRGDSCYSTIFGYLDQIDGYIDAVIIAARMAAVFGLVFKEETAAQNFQGLASLTNSKGNQQKALTLENGMVKYMGREDQAVQVTPQQPMNQTPDFIRVICRLLGLPFDMPLELVFKDLSQTSFSSARIGLIGYYRACRARQKTFMRRAMTRIYRWWLSREIKMGRITAALPPSPLLHKFMAEGWDYTDPVSEAQADLIAIDMGIKTPQMAAAERGRDWEEMQIDLKAAAALRRMAALPDVGSSMTRDRIEVVTAAPGAKEPAPLDPVAEFKQKVWLGFQADGTVADVMANMTGLRELTQDVGLPLDPKYVEPWLPVQDAQGNAVTGQAVKDPEGDVVGGAVEAKAPAPIPTLPPAAPGSEKPAEAGAAAPPTTPPPGPTKSPGPAAPKPPAPAPSPKP